MKGGSGMKKEEILKMESGRELDALVAAKVMGWKTITVNTPYRYVKNAGGCIVDGTAERLSAGLIPHQWFPSRDIADAWEVVEKMNDCLHLKQHGKDGIWEAFFCISGPDMEGSGETASLAICRAALLTVSEGKEV